MTITEIWNCSTESDNVYFANNEETLLTLFIIAFCLAHAKHNVIKLKVNESRYKQFRATQHFQMY